MVHSRVAVCLLQRQLRNKDEKDLVIDRTPAKMRRVFKSLLTAMSLQSLRLNWYSLRRGGATWFFLSTGSMERTLVRGRWQSAATARLYIQDATAEVTNLKLTKEQHELLALASRKLL